jgi:hypothetical protein
MRLLFAIIILALSSATGFGQLAEFSIKSATVKLPKAKEGEQVEHVYQFTNTGSAPLVISSYKVACSCTKLELPKGPIAPGQKGELKLSFDTHGKSFYQDRIIYLEMNTKKKTEKLRFKIYVEPKQ